MFLCVRKNRCRLRCVFVCPQKALRFGRFGNRTWFGNRSWFKGFVFGPTTSRCGICMNYGLWEHSVAILAEGDMEHMISHDDEGSYRVGSNSISGTALGRRDEGEVTEKL